MPDIPCNGELLFKPFQGPGRRLDDASDTGPASDAAPNRLGHLVRVSEYTTMQGMCLQTKRISRIIQKLDELKSNAAMWLEKVGSNDNKLATNIDTFIIRCVLHISDLDGKTCAQGNLTACEDKVQEAERIVKRMLGAHNELQASVTTSLEGGAQDGEGSPKRIKTRDDE